ncbi:MAG: TolC family protein [Candidatus Zixiibacteriota bacterium]|nr:MAG: TolC family protein [candidate division Zixibacteria bacterium]
MFRPWLTALVLLASIITAGKIQAGQETLDSLIAAALANNPELSSADFRARASEYRAYASAALPDPVFSVSPSNLPHSSLALDETPMSGLSLGLSQTIPWPGKLKARSHAGRFQQQQDEATAQAVRNRLIREVTGAYFDYSYWLLAGRTIDENIALIDATTRVTEERYAQGKASAHDVLRAQTTLSRLQIRRLKAAQEQESALLQLWRTVKDSSLISHLPAYLPEFQSDQRGLPTIAGNPLVHRAEASVKQAEAQRHLARSGYWPDFTVGVDYRLREASPGDPLAGEDFLSFKVGISLPLWFFSKQKNEVRASQQMLLARRENEQAVRDRLDQQLKDNRLNLGVLAESLEKYDRAILPQARAGFEAAEIAYEVGRIDFNALLSAEMELLDVQLERLELLNRINQTRAQLAELAGQNYER